MTRFSLLDYFSALADPRQHGKVLYPLPEIMLLIQCVTLAGAGDFVGIREWGCGKLRFLRSLRPFTRGIPSHDTLNDTMAASRSAATGSAMTRVGCNRHAAPPASHASPA